MIQTTDAKRSDKLILVYDGESGLGAMLLDVVKKAVGREDCPLCEITYGPLGHRRAWNDCAARIGIAVQELHRDELPPDWGVPKNALPCVLVRAGEDRPRVLLRRETIVSCGGQVAELERRLTAALAGD